MKTNAVRKLEALGVPHELRAYDVNLDDLTAVNVAAKIGVPPEQVFKALVVSGVSTGIAFALVPGNSELDLKALAKLVGDRKMELTPLKDVQPLTGYIRGGVTAIGAKKNYPLIVDESMASFKVISVSAGVRGLQILMDPEDYRRVVNGRTGRIARRTEPRHGGCENPEVLSG